MVTAHLSLGSLEGHLAGNTVSVNLHTALPTMGALLCLSHFYLEDPQR